MNHYGEENPFCYFHPKEKLVGVCAFCLKERLLILAAKQGHLPLSKDTSRSYNVLHRKSTLTIPKIFALGSFLHRSHHTKSEDFDHHHQDTSTSSPEDSFISIKFEDNGIASWDKDKGANTKVSLVPSNNQKLNNKVSLNNPKSNKETTKTVIEHVKPHASPLWWRKRIGQLFQLVRWKRSNKAKACHVGSKVGGVKVMRKGWIRSLTKKKRTME
ncbi:hypothetical protein FRX31_004472 [Thalictrum thalictroides]|uniref:Uncharacterized protein n=1 Tax=Thalictrum thalictroides TaxID=46969 RepID=A0A7J6X933_THATH|nr:hypothetical protein FRX31_004472 [Thalictrum thalictroides]